MKESIKKLDFSAGIKAPDINYNFELLCKWIERERLRIGGHGLVEGFDMSADLKTFTVSVTEGSFINKSGEEQIVPAASFFAGAPTSFEMTVTLLCPIDGIIELDDRPYSPSRLGYFEYVPPTTGTLPDRDEFRIVDTETGLNVPVLQISGRKVYVNARDWRGSKLTVIYRKAEDRVDSILLTMDGVYKYEKSVISTSPSHIEIPDYEDCYMIGAVYWHIDTSITATFYDNHRTYRTVYVDEQNRLWINGELYKKPQFIYFEEPKPANVNDLWYDKESNTLYIWREDNGVWGWVPVNDNAKVTVRDNYVFIPTDNHFPADLQTFRFPEDRMDLHYVPGTNALTIIIDNMPLMSDQYEEIVSPDPSGKSYMAQGIGFKLADPLDRPTIIEVLVNHNVKGAPARETFQRAAIFVAEGYMYHTNTNTTKVYETSDSYAIGEEQLEVFLNGVRLIRNVDFKEMSDRNTVVEPSNTSVRKQMSTYFKIIRTVTTGQCISYRISKHVWNYDQVHLLMREQMEQLEANENAIQELKNQIKQLNDNVTAAQEHVNTTIANFESTINALPTRDEMLLKKDKINYQNLPAEIKAKFIKSAQVYLTMQTTVLQPLVNFTENDFIQVYYMSPTLSRILIKDMDYTLTPSSNGLRLDLQPSLIKSSATLYINGIKLGE